MKRSAFLVILLLFPTFIHARFFAKECNEVLNKMNSAWQFHHELMQQFNDHSALERENNMHLLHEAIHSCQKAIGYAEKILEKIAEKPKEERKDKYWIEMKNICKQNIEVFKNQINYLQMLAQETHRVAAFEKASLLYLESLRKIELANSLNQNSSFRGDHLDAVAIFTHMSELYHAAAEDARSALELISSYPDEGSKSILLRIIAECREAVSQLMRLVIEGTHVVIDQSAG